MRLALELDSVVTMDIADGQSNAGWCFLSGTTCASFPEKQAGPFYLHEVYTASTPDCTTRITVPILWDTKLRKVVSNNSWSIMKMLATSFRPLSPGGPRGLELYPPALAAKIEEEHTLISHGLLNGVYRAGIPLTYGNDAAHRAASTEVYATLRRLESCLADQPFIVGDRFTLLDIRVAMTVLRYDAAYLDAFALGEAGHILGGTETSAFPAVRDWCRVVYTIVRRSVEWPAFPQYFRWTAGHDPASALPDLAAIIADVEQPLSPSRAHALLNIHL